MITTARGCDAQLTKALLFLQCDNKALGREPFFLARMPAKVSDWKRNIVCVQMIDALRTKLAARVAPASLPLLSEGETYRMELTVSETLTSATLFRIVDDTPLGRGFSFQLPGRRVFVYEKDLRPGPDVMLLVMVP